MTAAAASSFDWFSGVILTVYSEQYPFVPIYFLILELQSWDSPSCIVLFQ